MLARWKEGCGGEGEGVDGAREVWKETTVVSTGMLFFLFLYLLVPAPHREARAEQYEGRYKEYRQELKQHAQALKQVSQELQGERFSRNKLQGELDQCRQELQALEKCRRDLKDEQGTSHLLREQVQLLVVWWGLVAVCSYLVDKSCVSLFVSLFVCLCVCLFVCLCVASFHSFLTFSLCNAPVP